MITELTEEEKKVLEKNGGLKLAAEHCLSEARIIEDDIASLLRLPEMARDLKDIEPLVSEAIGFYQLAISFYRVVIEDITSNISHAHPVKNELLNDSLSKIHAIETKLEMFHKYK